MIKDFTDLAANERTYLAWIRTAVCIMAFGYLVEKFDLFVQYALHKSSGQTAASHSSEIIGIALMISGVIIIIVSTIRFFINQNLIRKRRLKDSSYFQLATIPDLFLGILMTVIGITAIVYIYHTVYS